MTEGEFGNLEMRSRFGVQKITIEQYILH